MFGLFYPFAVGLAFEFGPNTPTWPQQGPNYAVSTSHLREIAPDSVQMPITIHFAHVIFDSIFSVNASILLTAILLF